MFKSIFKNPNSLLFFIFLGVISSLSTFYLTNQIVSLYNYKELNANYMNPIENGDMLPWIMLLIPFILFMASRKKMYMLIVIIISFLYAVITLNSADYRKEIMQSRYEQILLKEPSFEGTKNAELLRVAIKDNKPNDYIKILTPFNDNQQPRTKELIRLFETIELVFPEYKEYTKNKLDDNFLSINEYNDIKNMIIKNIPKKELTKEQLAVIGELK